MDSRLFGIAAAVAGAALLIFGALHVRWVTGRDFGIVTNVGLLRMEICTPDPEAASESSCEGVSLAEALDSPSAPGGLGRYRTSALVTFGLGLLTALALLITTGLAAARKFVEHGIQPSSVALLGSVATILSAVVTLSINPYGSVGWGTGPGFLIFGAGATLALLGSILLGRLKPPPSEGELFDPPFDPV